MYNNSAFVCRFLSKAIPALLRKYILHRGLVGDTIVSLRKLLQNLSVRDAFSESSGK